MLVLASMANKISSLACGSNPTNVYKPNRYKCDGLKKKNHYRNNVSSVNIRMSLIASLTGKIYVNANIFAVIV